MRAMEAETFSGYRALRLIAGKSSWRCDRHGTMFQKRDSDVESGR
jgi:hypothetical protein